MTFTTNAGIMHNIDRLYGSSLWTARNNRPLSSVMLINVGLLTYSALIAVVSGDNNVLHVLRTYTRKQQNKRWREKMSS